MLVSEQDDVKATLMNLLKISEKYVGRKIIINEMLCTNWGNTDRHFTSCSDFLTTIKSISVRFSGARLRIEGDKVNYEIGIDSIYKIIQSKQSVYIYEYVGLSKDNCCVEITKIMDNI